MRRMAWLLALPLTVGIVVGALGARLLNAQQAEVATTDVLTAHLAGMGGKEGLVQFVEIAPGAATPKHYHPGDEIAYILEGSILLEIDGMSPLAAKAGEALHVPAQRVHAGKNASATAPLKILVFRIHEKGQPVTALVP